MYLTDRYGLIPHLRKWLETGSEKVEGRLGDVTWRHQVMNRSFWIGARYRWVLEQLLVCDRAEKWVLLFADLYGLFLESMGTLQELAGLMDYLEEANKSLM